MPRDINYYEQALLEAPRLAETQDLMINAFFQTEPQEHMDAEFMQPTHTRVLSLKTAAAINSEFLHLVKLSIMIGGNHIMYHNGDDDRLLSLQSSDSAFPLQFFDERDYDLD